MVTPGICLACRIRPSVSIVVVCALPASKGLNVEVFSVDETGIEAVIAPFLRPQSDFLSLLARTLKKLEKKKEKAPIDRNPGYVEAVYDLAWDDTFWKHFQDGGGDTACLWGPRQFVMGSMGIKRAYLLLIYRIIEKLAPRTVLEVGSGNGLNLLLLANRFPDIRFAGIELSANGVSSAKAMAVAPLPSYLERFSPQPLLTREAPNVTFEQASAVQLPYDDNSFDLVLTVQALEQMEAVRSQALSEIARVARRNTVMVEPFKEWNEDGLRRLYIESAGYFRGAICELPQYRLRPIATRADYPMKITIGVPLVVASKEL